MKTILEIVAELCHCMKPSSWKVREQEYRRRGAPASVRNCRKLKATALFPGTDAGERKKTHVFHGTKLCATLGSLWRVRGPDVPQGRRLALEPASRAHPLWLPSQLSSNYRSALFSSLFILCLHFLTCLEFFLQISSSWHGPSSLPLFLSPNGRGEEDVFS